MHKNMYNIVFSCPSKTYKLRVYCEPLELCNSIERLLSNHILFYNTTFKIQSIFPESFIKQDPPDENFQVLLKYIKTILNEEER